MSIIEEIKQVEQERQAREKQQQPEQQPNKEDSADDEKEDGIQLEGDDLKNLEIVVGFLNNDTIEQKKEYLKTVDNKFSILIREHLLLLLNIYPEEKEEFIELINFITEKVYGEILSTLRV